MTPPRAGKLALALAGLAFAWPAEAIEISITSFENGELVPSGGDAVGEARRRRRLFGIDPTDGNRMFIVSNRENNGATDEATIESTMGVPSGTIDAAFGGVPSTSTTGPTNGSAFRITFAAQAGDRLEFDWNFVTAAALPLEPLHTDFGWGHLSLDGTPLGQAALANANEGTFVDTRNRNYDQTGWQTVSLDLGATGSYTLTLGVMDVHDTFTNSFMIFDYFRIQRAPEPDTFLLVAMGLLGLAWQGRGRERRGESRRREGEGEASQRASSDISEKRSVIGVRSALPANSR